MTFYESLDSRQKARTKRSLHETWVREDQRKVRRRMRKGQTTGLFDGLDIEQVGKFINRMNQSSRHFRGGYAYQRSEDSYYSQADY